MKYNDEILNKIAESYSKKIDENTNLDNVILGYLEMMKNGSKIHIKPENRGKFNATKKKTGKTTEELTHSKNPENVLFLLRMLLSEIKVKNKGMIKQFIFQNIAGGGLLL